MKKQVRRKVSQKEVMHKEIVDRLKRGSRSKKFFNEWGKPLLFAVLYVGAIAVVVKQCKEELEITKGDRCIKNHIELIRKCENDFYKCAFFNRPDCTANHRTCVEPYNRCLGNF